MLRKKPALRPSAAELLKHPHLQPHVLKINLKYGSPRRNTVRFSDSHHHHHHRRRTQFMESEEAPKVVERERRRSFSNDRTLNPSISDSERDSISYIGNRKESSWYLSRRFEELSMGSTYKEVDVDNPMGSRSSVSARTPKLSPVKASLSLRRQSITPSQTPSLPMSYTPASKSCHSSSRRASFPLSTTKAAYHQGPHYRSNTGFPHGTTTNTPDISVNAPVLDKIVEFPNPTTSVSAQCLSNSPVPDGGDSMMKDKCMVQRVDQLVSAPSLKEDQVGGSKSCSDTRQRRFDMSSYQQRAEVLEGLLEFSARLLQQERLEELSVLLKPSGPEKVSSRETAIWLNKSFKETAT